VLFNSKIKFFHKKKKKKKIYNNKIELLILCILNLDIFFYKNILFYIFFHQFCI